MIDLHSHILPGIDDGPDHLDGSLAFARAAVAAGTERIVATPHVNSKYQLDAHSIAALPGRVERLNGELADRDIALRVEPGAEVALSRLRDLNAEQMRGLTLADGGWMLVESPYTRSLSFFEETLFLVQSHGISVALAHPERCPAFTADPALLEKQLDQGVVAIVNSGSLQGTFGSSVRRVAYDLLRRGWVHALASDSHDERRRPPEITPGIEAATRDFPELARHATRLTVTAPRAILDGGAVPKPVALNQRPLSRLLSRFR